MGVRRLVTLSKETLELEDSTQFEFVNAEFEFINAVNFSLFIDLGDLFFAVAFQMETITPDDGHIIQVCGDVAAETSNRGGIKICGEVPCGFTDSTTTSMDAKERSSSTRKLLIAVALCVVFMTVEVVGGIKANSLAILTDAAHLLSDVAAFAISLFSIWASGWEATPRQSYGFFRIEILGALISIQMIWLLAGILVYEAIVRLIHDTGEVQGFLMFVVSTFGLVVNIAMALLLGHNHGDHHSHDPSHDDHGHHGTEPLLKNGKPKQRKRSPGLNINLQGAYLHVLGDSIQSVGVMIGGAIIWYEPRWKVVDLICTLFFSAVVLGTTVRMLRSILEVLMESTPREIDATRLEKGLCQIDEVVTIHELHIWAITIGKVLLACHVKIRREANADAVLDQVIDYIRREYNITHVTIQIERE